MKRNPLLFIWVLAIFGMCFLHVALWSPNHQDTGFLGHINCSILSHLFVITCTGLSTLFILPQTGFAHPEPIILREQEVVLSLFMPP